MGVRIRSAFEAVSVHFAMVVQFCQTYTDREDGKTLAICTLPTVHEKDGFTDRTN